MQHKNKKLKNSATRFIPVITITKLHHPFPEFTKSSLGAGVCILREKTET